MVEDFIDSGGRLTDKLKKLLNSCEMRMLKVTKKQRSTQLGKNAGIEFVDSIFGRDRELEATERLMASIRLWNMRFDVYCEGILRSDTGLSKYGSNQALEPQYSKFPAGYRAPVGPLPTPIVMTPVAIRTTFGLEDIIEEPPTRLPASASSLAIYEERHSGRIRSKVWGEGIKKIKSTNNSVITRSPKLQGVTASTARTAPSTSVPEGDLDGWGTFISSKAKKRKKKAPSEFGPIAEENGIVQQPAQVDTGHDARSGEQSTEAEPLKDANLVSNSKGGFGFDPWGSSWSFDSKISWDFEKPSKDEGAAKKPGTEEDPDLLWGFPSKKKKQKSTKKIGNFEEILKHEEFVQKAEIEEAQTVVDQRFFTKTNGEDEKETSVWDVEETLKGEGSVVTSTEKKDLDLLGWGIPREEKNAKVGPTGEPSSASFMSDEGTKYENDDGWGWPGWGSPSKKGKGSEVKTAEVVVHDVGYLELQMRGILT